MIGILALLCRRVGWYGIYIVSGGCLRAMFRGVVVAVG